MGTGIGQYGGDSGGGHPDGVTRSWMVSVFAFVNLPLHHKVQKFSSGTGSPGWSRKKGRKAVVVWFRESSLTHSDISQLTHQELMRSVGDFLWLGLVSGVLFRVLMQLLGRQWGIRAVKPVLFIMEGCLSE